MKFDNVLAVVFFMVLATVTITCSFNGVGVLASLVAGLTAGSFASTGVWFIVLKLISKEK